VKVHSVLSSNDGDIVLAWSWSAMTSWSARNGTSPISLKSGHLRIALLQYSLPSDELFVYCLNRKT